MKDFPLTCEASGYENYLRIFRIYTQILPIRFLLDQDVRSSGSSGSSGLLVKCI